MTSGDTNNAGPRGSWIKILLLPFVLLLLTAVPAFADDCVGDYGGVIDGTSVNPAPSQINIDGNCTIRNFTGSNPLSSNISFFTSPGQNNDRWLVVFDNVRHTGQMSCNAVQGHKIWFTNGSSTGIHPNCQNLLIPVEKINKQNPAGQTTATIAVPFTYTLTIPVLFDPATGNVINNSGSVNNLHGITVTDDLNATGASLSYVSHTITWRDDGTAVPHTFSNVGGLLTFDNFPIVTAGRQFVIALTVVLNDTPANVPGTQFINTAKWDFGRLIDGTFYEPLPGEWGVTPPMTIGAPVLVVDKSGPATMNLGQWGNFAINVQNTGLGDAWNASVSDLLPDGATGGMCDRTPEVQSARVFAADGVTPVPGKGPLNPGIDYLLSYSAAPTCRLEMTMLTPAGRIGPNERLILRYRTQLDAGTQNGITLTNIAGATQWFNGDSSNSNRVAYNRTLTNGTVSTVDHEDAHTVTVALTGYFFEKTVANLTSGANPAATAAPGDRLRYTLRFQTTDQPLTDFRIVDELDALNAVAAFAPGTLSLVSYPAGADISNTNSTGGAKGTGVLDVRNLSLPINSQLIIQFEINLRVGLANASVVANQSTLRLSNGTAFAVSDDPTVNGAADSLVSGDEDQTRVTIVSAPAFRVQKISTDLTGDPNVLLAGETLRYTITVKNIGNEDAVNATLRDAMPVNTTYVAGSTTLNGAAVADVAGLSPLASGMPIHSPANPTPGSMPADASASPANVATITFDVVVSSTVPDGTVISNQGFVSAIDHGIVDQPSDDPATPIANDPTRDVVGNLPLLYAEKRVVLSVDLGSPGVVDPGDTLRYTITVQNSAAISATGVVLTDAVPANTTYVANSTLLNGSPVGQPDGGVSPLASGVNVGVISAGTTATLQFDLSVNLGTPTGTLISNQAVVDSVELPNLLTDGDGNPATGPEPTVVVVGAGQQLSITKQVTVVGGGAALPGTVLEYVVRVTNIGAVSATNVVITDNLDASSPGQLTYVNGSATMNGSTAGVNFAGSTITADYAAVNGPLGPGAVVLLRFRAALNTSLPNGTVVTNTGVVAWNIPTQTANASVAIAVGSTPGTLPSLFSEKRVALFVDLGSPGIVDPGDTLRYTITTQNSGTNAATGLVLRDNVPANTTYVANSTLLNGSPFGQPDGGVSPLVSGVNAGTIVPGATSTLQFDLLVNAGTPAGTLISNQAVVDSVELPNLLTDGDGNRATGPEPTVIAVGVGQQVSITKEVTVVGGGAALPGATLEYVVNVTNIAAMPATNVVITDDIGASASGQLTYVSGSATMNGSTSGVSVAGSAITADYAAVSGPLGAGAGVVLRFRAVLNAGLATGTVVTNTGVVGWNNPTQTANASVSIVVGSLPGLSVLNGSTWHDADFDNVRDPGERPLVGWSVELYRNSQLWNSMLTDANGVYRFIVVEPNEGTGVQYELRSRAPGAGANTALLGNAASPFTNGLQRISDIVVPSGANLQDLNLPIHPNGVVYNSIARIPVVGATLTLTNAGTASPLPASCFDDAAQQGQITLAEGYYKFGVNFSNPACPSGGDYLIAVTPPAGTTYIAGYSQIIPPISAPSTAAFSVPACPASADDAIPGTALFCEVQPSEFAPIASVPPRTAGTNHHVHVRLDGSQTPGSSQIFNNHIAIDPDVSGTIAISKTTPMLNVTRGQLVPYVITVNNVASLALTDVRIVDRFPAGFSYVAGSARLDGVPIEPSVSGLELQWNGLAIAGTQVRALRLLLTVGAGVTEGEYRNRAQVFIGTTGSAISGEAIATVRVIPDPTFDCTDVTGKVFNDLNRNGLQDIGEEGLSGVRVVTARGLQATTDQYGRYHITCAITPNESRGSNFVLKLDDRTLPSGFRMSMDQLQIKRVTRGKALSFNFGASIQRVVGIDLSDAVFEPGTTEIRGQWRPRLNLLLEELRKAPAVLRLSYVADTEDAALVERRAEAVKRQLTEAWDAAKYGYVLTIEPEVFWRLGAPAKRPDVPATGKR